MSINLSIKYCIFYEHDPKKYRRKMISSYIFLIYNEKQETNAKKNGCPFGQPGDL